MSGLRRAEALGHDSALDKRYILPLTQPGVCLRETGGLSKVKTLDCQIHPCFHDVWSSHLGLHMQNCMALN